MLICSKRGSVDVLVVLLVASVLVGGLFLANPLFSPSITGFAVFGDNSSTDCGKFVNDDSELAGNISGCNGDGLVINKSNIVLNCTGYSISFNETGSPSSDDFGILNNGFDNVTIKNCNVAGFYRGFYFITSADNSSLINNSAFGNNESGIYFILSNNSNLTGNIAYGSKNGFLLQTSNNFSLSNNIAYNNLGAGFFLQTGKNNILFNNTAYNNSNVTADGFNIGPGSDGNILINNLAYGNNRTGFYLSNADNNLLDNNTANPNVQNGFVLERSYNNTLSNNLADNNFANANHGFVLQTSENNTLVNNTAFENVIAGFKLEANSRYNLLNNNTAYNNSAYGFFLSSSSDNNTLVNNTAQNNSIYGFLVDDSRNNSFLRNIAYKNSEGFRLAINSSYNLLDNNTADNNSQYGFRLRVTSDNNILSNNTAHNSSASGFFLENSRNNSLLRNIAYNNSIGFQLLVPSNYNLLADNYAYNNSLYGFYLDRSNNNSLSYNYAYNNSRGIFLSSSNYSSLTNNSAFNNSQYGFYLLSSSNSNLSNNTAYNNSQYGFYLESSSNNSLSYNLAYNNSLYGFYLLSSQNNTLYNNNAYSNVNSGVLFNLSSENILVKNILSGNSIGLRFLASANNTLVNTTLNSNATWIFAANSSNNTFTRTLFNASNGSINILSTVTLPANVSVNQSNLNVTPNNAFLNSTNLTFLNTTAEITFSNILFTYPEPIADFNDDGVFGSCANSTDVICSIVSFVGNVFVYNVTHFTSYSSQDDTTPPEIYFVSPTEDPGSLIGRDYVLVNVSAFDFYLANITIYLYNSTGSQINSSNSTTSPLFANFTGLANGLYFFNATAYDNATNSNSTGTRNVTIDVISCGNYINNNTNLTSNITACAGDGLIINASSITLDCKGYYITSDGIPDLGDYGIFAISKNNITIENCNVAGFIAGFLIQVSNSSIINNSAYNNNETGFLMPLDNITFIGDYNTLQNNIAYNNSVNGSGDRAAGFLLANTSYNNITSNQAYNNNGTGFIFTSISNNTIFNNSAYNNSGTGFVFGGDAIYNNVSGNSAFGNIDIGFRLFSGAGANYFVNNSANNNQNVGFTIESANNTFVNNSAYNNSGISGNKVGFAVLGSFNILINNSASYNTLTGFFVITSSANNNSLFNNTAYGGNKGFWFSGVQNNTASGNLAYNNTNYGFELTNSNFNNLDNNSAFNNTQYGFYLHDSSNNNNISNNLVYNNSLAGVLLLGSANESLYNISKNNTFSGNIIYNNPRGVNITNSSSNILNNNTIYNSSVSGIILNLNSSSNLLSYNNIYNNTFGVFFTNSSNNTLANNSVYNNSNGLNLFSSQNNTLFGNVIYGNINSGILFNSSSANILANNILSGNAIGLRFLLSENNTLSNTTLNSNATWMSAVNSSDNTFTRTLFNASNGSINILSTVTLPANVSVNQSNLNVTPNNAFLNSTNLTFLNTTADITFSNILFTYPEPIADFNDDGVFGACANSTDIVCSIVSFTSNAFVYNVTHFTSYSSQEDATPPEIYFVSPTEDSGSLIGRDYVLVNVSAFDFYLANITIYLYNSTGSQINSSNSTTSPLFANFTGLANGLYYFNATAYDNATNFNFTETRNVTIDTAAPVVTLNYPPGGNITSSTSFNFNWTATDGTDTNLSCNLTINGTVNASDIASLNNTPTNYTVAGFTDGFRYWNVTCLDDAGNFNTSETRNFTVDTVVPAISFETPTEAPGSFISTNNIVVNVSATDTNLQNITIYLYNSTGSLINLTNSSTSPLFSNFTGLGDGRYFFNASAHDFASNTNYTETRNVTIDTVNPAITFEIPTEAPGATVNRNNIVINVSAADINLANITIYLYNSTNALVNSSNSTSSQLFSNFTGLADGLYYFNATAYDNATNFNSTETRNVTIDTAAPVVTLNYPPGGNITSSTSFNFNWTATDNIDTNLSCNLTIDSSVNVSGVESLNNTPVNYTVSDFADGLHYWNVTCLDDSGNFNTSATINFTVDTVKPAISFETPTETPGTTIGRDNIVVNVSATDANLQNITIYLYNSSGVLINLTNSSTSPLFVNYTGLADGLYYFNASAHDFASNTNYTETRNVTIDVTIDTVAPAVTLNYPPGGIITTNTSFNFNWTAVDDIDGNLTCNLSVSGSAGAQNIASLNNTPVNYTLSSISAGAHYWNVSCFDDDLNTNISETRNFTVEEAPEEEGVAVTSGGGGRSGAPIISRQGILIVTETPKEVKVVEGARQNFLVEGYTGEYYLIPTDITEESVIITISGKKLIISKGSEFEVDVDGDGKTDIKIMNSKVAVSRRINGETVTEVYLVMVKIASAPAVEVEAGKAPEAPPVVEKPVAEIILEVRKLNYWTYLIPLIILVVLVAVLVYVKIRKHKKSK